MSLVWRGLGFHKWGERRDSARIKFMRKFAETCEAIAGTTKKLLKVGIVAEYLTSRTVEEASVSAVFLSGKPFPAWEEATLQVGGRLLWQVVSELSGKSEEELTAAYRRRGDLGSVAGDVLAGPRHTFNKASRRRLALRRHRRLN